MKIEAVTRKDVASLHHSLRKTPYEANRVLAALSVVFRCAEVWGLRSEGSNPCRLVPRYPEKRRERLLTDSEVTAIFRVLSEAEVTATEPTSILLAIRLLFATAGRASEILGLRWDYIRSETSEIVWPDNKIGGEIRKPLTREIANLLRGADRIVGTPYVCLDGTKTGPLSISRLEKAWKRILKVAKVAPCGLHAIRHRAATEIANNPDIPVHVGMKLTGHKTVATFMRYVHAQRSQALIAAEKLSKQRQALVTNQRPKVVRLASAAARRTETLKPTI